MAPSKPLLPPLLFHRRAFMGFHCKSERKQISEISLFPSKPALAGRTGLGFSTPTRAIEGFSMALLSTSIYPMEEEGPDPNPSTGFWGDSVFLELLHPRRTQAFLSGQDETCLVKTTQPCQKHLLHFIWHNVFPKLQYLWSQSCFLVSSLVPEQCWDMVLGFYP